MLILYQIKYLSWVIFLSTFCNAEKRHHLESVTTNESTRRVAESSQRGQKLNSEGIEKAGPAPGEEDEERKTLAQQVADGKYGLIQKELFSKPAKRPGILSYEINPEVPKDNVNNLGGLQPEEIWLAENHLLVLKGGILSEDKKKIGSSWPPIDNYVAPRRQVKLPSDPRVPPPFPVQLSDGGPLVLVKGQSDQKQKHSSNQNSTGSGQNGTGALYPPSFPFLPPPENLSELDEDDPRIYYPPPYDFVFHKDNSSGQVAPGPLVPGIVLPPPPDFFGPLVAKTKHRHQAKPTESRKQTKPKVHISSTTTSTLRPVTTTTSLDLKSTTSAPREGAKTVPRVEITRAKVTTLKTTLPTPKEINDGWVPIPAPTPQTITIFDDLRPILDSTKTDRYNLEVLAQKLKLDGNERRPRPDYGRGKYYYRVIDEVPSPEYRPYDKSKEYRHPNPTSYDGFKPIVLDLQPQVSTDPPAHYPHRINVKEEKKLNEMFYFYEEPYIVEAEVRPYRNRGKSPGRYLPEGQKIQYETNTLAPPKYYEEASPPRESYLEPHYVKPPQSDATFQYIYYNREPVKEPDYQYDTVLRNKDTYQQIGVYKIQNERQNKMYSKQRLSTTKSPIYEYSFSAPGYGTTETPKIGTTPKSVEYEGFTPIKRPQYSYYEYQTTPKYNTVYVTHKNRAPPQVYTTMKPNYERNRGYTNIHTIFQTESPFNNFFTQDPGNLDDNTKKYFTLFGQKINSATTPIPPTNGQNGNKQYYQPINTKGQVQTDTNSHKLHYQNKPYNFQAQDAYYMKDQHELSEYKFPLTKPRHNIEQNIKLPQFYLTPLTEYQRYNYHSGIIKPGHSLESDVNVNYKNPPPVNTDAEILESHYLNQDQTRANGYISYELPGSGGHFYFLTPRSVKEDYSMPNSGYSYTNEEQYKRNAQKVRRKRPKSILAK